MKRHFGPLWQSLKKLNPLSLLGNPVMFITEIGAIITMMEWIFTRQESSAFYAQVSLWLWLTVLFSNWAESVAEMRNQRQAESLRSKRVETRAELQQENGEYASVDAQTLRRGNIVRVRKGEIIPGDGEIIHGSASIDESSITGESAPVIRASGTDHSSVTGGTRLLSDEILVKISADPGQGFLDRMINLIESAKRKKSTNELALTILLSGLTFIFLVVVVAIKIFGSYFRIDLSVTMLVALLICLIPTTIAGLLSAIGIAGINRLMKSHVLAMSGQAVESAGDVDLLLIDKTGTITEGHRQASDVAITEGASMKTFVEAAWYTSLQDETDEGRSIIDFLRKHYPEEIPASLQEYGFIPFSAETQMSGAEMEMHSYRKGSCHAIAEWIGKAVPQDAKEAAEKYAEAGGTPLFVADGKQVLGVILLKDKIKEGLSTFFATFRKMGIRTVMITGDNPITAKTIAQEAEIEEFLAEVTPERKLQVVQMYQREGMMVAMTGDGVNDAPALAHADIGVAMNSGTQAAKEAANMIDLDSHPEKLFQIVEIGKQMLMTRGSLTTFSIANDMAKYFAIIPAILMSHFPLVANLNIMHLQTPESAVLSAVIFNALVIPLLIPLAFRGVALAEERAQVILRRNLAIYGIGGILVPFVGIKCIDLLLGYVGLI
ncbi:MAG: potassium-transporting ATPase subunit KdpB [Verrucomicrobiota bacterium]|nr:potassium-transporting ATPase subunit KdpB [Verrucomicrobiota bacterium]